MLCTLLFLVILKVLRQILSSISLEEANISSPTKHNVQIVEGCDGTPS